jgi:hypothetical protein
MMILVSKAPVSLERHRAPNLGCLTTPRNGHAPESLRGWTWAMDNDAFSGFDEPAYRRMLDRYHDIPGCLWVTLPDVVGDPDATLNLANEWMREVAGMGYPIALVAQDGMTADDIPWFDIDCLFIGGTDGPHGKRSMGPLMAEANRQGKWVHVGRINTRPGLRWAKSHGADSVDGSSFARWTDTHLPWALEYARHDDQMALRYGVP